MCSEIILKISGIKRKIAFINNYLNLDSIMISDVSKDKESFSKFWVAGKVLYLFLCGYTKFS